MKGFIYDFVNNYGEKILLSVIAYLGSFIVLLIVKEMFYNVLANFSLYSFSFGEENATKIVNIIFLTPSKIIFEQFGIGLYSLGIVLIINYKNRK